MIRKFILPLGFLAVLTPAMAKADIVVGISGPFTGQMASFGEQFRKGAEMAAADINAAGGIAGQKLVLEMADDACDPKQAVAAANQLVAKGVNAVVGHFCSGSSIPASDIYAEEQIIQISPGSSNPLYTERDLPTTFRVCGRDDQQGQTATDYITRHYAGKNVAIVHDKSAYGKGLADEVQKLLLAKDIKPVMYEAITPGEKDYSALVSRMKAAKVDILYFGGYHQEAGLIVRQSRAQGLKAPLMSGDSLMTSEFWAITGKDGNGTLMTFSPDPRQSESAKAVVAKFKKQGFEPEGYTLYTYAAVQVLADAFTKAGGTAFKDVAPLLKKEKFSTVMGPLSFDAKGDVMAPGYVVYEWKDGKYQYAEKAM